MAVTPNDAIEERRREIQKKRNAAKAKRRKRFLKRLLIFLCIVAVIVLVILSLTVFFPIQKITVDSNSKIYTNEQIIEASGIKKGDNLWMSGLNAEESIPTKLPFISKAEVERKFPSSIVIKTELAKASYSFSVEKDYYICDSEYKVLEIKKEQNKNTILILGSGTSKTKAGNKLLFSDTKKSELMEKLVSGLKEKNINVNTIDIVEPMDMKIRVEGRFNVHLGSSAYFESKLSHLAGMLQKVEKDVKGSIDLSDYTPENGRGILTRE